jgi:hypothetical protein
MLVAVRLAKSGYFQGDPEKVLQADADHVLMLVNYDTFLSNYEKVYFELNKPETK